MTSKQHFVYIASGKNVLKIGETCDVNRRNRELKSTKIVHAICISGDFAKAKAKYVESVVQETFNDCLVDGMLDHFSFDDLALHFGLSKFWPANVFNAFVKFVDDCTIENTLS